MTRVLVLGAFLAAGVVGAAYQPPAQPAGPKVVLVEKQKASRAKPVSAGGGR